MIIRSLDVRIVNVFVSTAIRVRLYNTCFRALCFFFRAIRSPPPPSPKVPVRLCTYETKITMPIKNNTLAREAHDVLFTNRSN